MHFYMFVVFVKHTVPGTYSHTGICLMSNVFLLRVPDNNNREKSAVTISSIGKVMNDPDLALP